MLRSVAGWLGDGHCEGADATARQGCRARHSPCWAEPRADGVFLGVLSGRRVRGRAGTGLAYGMGDTASISAAAAALAHGRDATRHKG